MSMKSRVPFRPLIKEPATEVVGTGELLKQQTGQARHHRLSETGQARNRSEPVNRSGQAPSIGTDRGNELPRATWRVKSRPRNHTSGRGFSLARVFAFQTPLSSGKSA